MPDQGCTGSLSSVQGQDGAEARQPAHVGDWYFPMRWAGRDQWAMLHQVKMVSVARFEFRMAELPEPDVLALKVAFRALMGL